MNLFRLTPQASDDLKAIGRYLSVQAGDQQAIRVIQQIQIACKKLAVMPGMGHYREDLLGRDYRFWSVYSYVIAYRWQATPIEVIAVVHGARELRAFFQRRLP